MRAGSPRAARRLCLTKRNLLEDLISSVEPAAECKSEALGMESEAITDAQITGSSRYDVKYSWTRARLNIKADRNGYGSWSVRKNDGRQWIQVDFGDITTVKAVATQGRYDSDQWVTAYSMQYSDDGQTFHFYKEEGETTVKVIKRMI